VIFTSTDFVFRPPPQVSRALQILIKPAARYPLPYPVSTSPLVLERVVDAIRRVSDADIIILETSAHGEPMKDIYKTLGYSFPRVQTMDVRDCVLVEVENPLPRPFALSTFWLPNLVLYCDYSISICPFSVSEGRGNFSVMNLLGLLPMSKYGGEYRSGWGILNNLGIDRVIADLYFTLPFDLGIVDAGKKFFTQGDDSTRGTEEPYNRVFVGEPLEVDREVADITGIEAEYLTLIETAKPQVEY